MCRRSHREIPDGAVGPARLPAADAADHARGLVHLGHQHPVPARRRASTTRRHSPPTRSSPLGQVIFEVPTGVVADTRGRRFSFMLGARPCWRRPCCTSSCGRSRRPSGAGRWPRSCSGFGFTFFSGATEAWLVDALTATGFKGNLETVFGRAQTVGGGAMLVGSVLGGVIAQATDLGVPYIVRAGMLGVTLRGRVRVHARPRLHARARREPGGRGPDVVPRRDRRRLRNPPVRWLMLAAPFTCGVGFYAFYALQPYLLELYGDPNAYSIAGLAAAIIAGAQIVGGLLVPVVRRLFRRRTDALILGAVLNVVLAGAGRPDRELRGRARAVHGLGVGRSRSRCPSARRSSTA